MEEALIAYLLADPGLRTLVGNRINWHERPQGSKLPALVLHRVSGEHDYHMDGPSGLIWTRIQGDAWARTYTEALYVARGFIAAAHALRGIHLGTQFQGVFVDAQRDLPGTTDNADVSERLKAVSVDLRIWHSSL